MNSPLASRLDRQGAWRSALDREVRGFQRFLAEHELADPVDTQRLDALHQRLQVERLTVAFVAEFSRGKSELINAIFFADAGRRVLPATPGRTTMCPVELFHDGDEKPSLALLPIETRLKGLSLAELRTRDEPWRRLPLDPKRPEALAKALAAVTETRQVTQDVARQLGFWRDDAPDDNPPLDDDGTVEVPAWRHALINYPHPLLQRGLVVLDTPGLNAIGAEPELTLSLLPSAHATVFILGADAGVTKSDLAVWREHLGGSALERFVVLNKIDALRDPMAKPTQVKALIEQQRQATARTLGLPAERVFPLSAREALAARIAGNDKTLARSRLPELETALAAELLPRQSALLAGTTTQTLRELRNAAVRRLGDRRRQNAEQMLELRGLRGKSGAKVRLMLGRIETEAADFERCAARLVALRRVQMRHQRTALARLSSDALRSEVAAMQSAATASALVLGRKPFALMFERLQAAIDAAEADAAEMQRMLEASFQQLNAEFGFAFTIGIAPDLSRYRSELEAIAQGYGRYLGLSQAWRMAVPGFVEQFRRLLLSKLRIVFENAAGDIELWSKGATAQVDQQLRERRRGLQRRREALERIESATGDLEARITEVEAQDAHLSALHKQLDAALHAAIAVSERPTDDAEADASAA